MSARFACPCCFNMTLNEQPPGTFLICPVCYWEDDELQYRDEDLRGGANEVGLKEAQANYRCLGVSDPRFQDRVRQPTAEERGTPPGRVGQKR